MAAGTGRVRISAPQARRIALAAQGFAASQPSSVAMRHVRAVFDRIGVIQIDSVNALIRSHYLPLFSRLGAYDVALLEECAYDPKQRELFEYWGHEASLVPLALHPLLRWRMARAQRHEAGWEHVREIARTQPSFVEGILKQIEMRGALSAGELVAGGKGAGSWWGWSDGKRALEWLFWAGKVTTSHRRGFERVYDLPERVLPKAILSLPTPSEHEAQRALLRIAARACGIATERDLRDYFRLSASEAKVGIAELVDAGELIVAQVEGWTQAGYLCPKAAAPRKVTARALLSPFDSLVWDRARTERIFGFTYRLEIYTPAHKRVHGYYVLPFLYGDQLVARIDLKSARKDKALDVYGVHYEPNIKSADVVEALARALREMAAWMGHEHIRVLTRSAAAKSLRELLRQN
jgi:uncharacterized protein YcaQ